MDYYALLQKRQAAGKPVRVGVIGAGKFGSMYIAQARFTPGVQLVGVADLEVDKARKNCMRTGWTEDKLALCKTTSAVNDAARKGKIAIVDDAEKLIKADFDILLEVTGIPDAGAYNAWTALDYGKHVVVVSVEADTLVGMALRKKADRKGLAYSIAYGDEPGCICELVDWARTCGFEVVSAGKDVPHTEKKRYLTPDTGWKAYGLTEQQIASGDYNLKMYNSFADGTKTETEICAVCNACGLMPQKAGLTYPALELADMPDALKPISEGGMLEHSGTVEVLTNVKPDGTRTHNPVSWGVYVSYKAQSDYVRDIMRDFRAENRIITDKSGAYSVLYRPTHIIGLELGISVASVGLFGMVTGSPRSFMADVGAFAKKDLKPGEVLDGEGGFTTYGKLVRAQDSLKGNYMPAGLGDGAKLKKAVKKDTPVTYDDVEIAQDRFLYKLRKDMEKDLKAGK